MPAPWTPKTEAGPSQASGSCRAYQNGSDDEIIGMVFVGTDKESKDAVVNGIIFGIGASKTVFRNMKDNRYLKTLVAKLMIYPW